MWFVATGKLRYGNKNLVVDVDQQLADYYRSLLPFYWNHNRCRFDAHISVVRLESPAKLDLWGKHDGETISFEYSNEIAWDDIYIWLPVRSQRLEDIRVELGLPFQPWWKNLFHITVANKKEI